MPRSGWNAGTPPQFQNPRRPIHLQKTSHHPARGLERRHSSRGPLPDSGAGTPPLEHRVECMARGGAGHRTTPRTRCRHPRSLGRRSPDRNPGGLEPSAAALAGCGRQTGLYGRTLQRIRVYPGHHQPSPVDPPTRSRHLEGQWTGVPDNGTPRRHLAGRFAGNGILARKYCSQRSMGPESSRNPPLSDLHPDPQSSPPAGGRTQLKDPAHHRPLRAPRVQPLALRIHPN